MANFIVCQPSSATLAPLSITLESPTDGWLLTDEYTPFSGTLSADCMLVDVEFNLEGGGWTYGDQIVSPTAGWVDVYAHLTGWETGLGVLEVRLKATRGVEIVYSNVYSYTVNLPD
jgi:hypothetical protein